MNLTLLSPTSSESFEINWLEVETTQGNQIIAQGHAPTILLLTPRRELTIELNDGTKTVIMVDGGILEVTRTTATLILTYE